MPRPNGATDASDPAPEPPRSRFRRFPWSIAAALLAALPQLVVYSEIGRSGRYSGSAYEPRVDAFIAASQTGVDGGPFATVPKGEESYSTAPVLLSDLGVAAIADGLGRLRGRPIDRMMLGWVNLGFLTVACVGLVLVMPPACRWALVPVLLLSPLSAAEYRSPDVVGAHGAFAALALAGAVAVRRLPQVALALGLGVLLFALHKLRAPYGLYALASALAVGMVLLRVPRARGRRWAHLGVALLTLVVLQVPWGGLVAARAADPRVVDGGTLTSHGAFQPLISGVGWSENRWGIQPWDLKVQAFIAGRFDGELVDIATHEAERRARVVYMDLWREAPAHLLGLYIARVPKALDDYFLLGWPGGLAWLLATAPALVLAWRRRDPAALAALTATTMMILALLAQAVLIDTRLLYAYPLRFLSATGLTVTGGLLVEFAVARFRQRAAPPAKPETQPPAPLSL